ncbi:transferase family-domain-containing protein [Syncephalis plumigaleata]|nr:transferase family-domain-containing protein [Syncephalis plumigaleata]
MNSRVGYRLRPVQPQPPAPHLDLSQLDVPLPCLFMYKNDKPANVFMPTEALLRGLQRAIDAHPVLYGIHPSTEGVHIYTSNVAYPIASFDSQWSHATICRGLDVPTWLHHYCVDIYSLVKFISTWASFLPLFDRSLFRGIPEQSPHKYHEVLSSMPTTTPLGMRVGAMLRISAAKIADLKAIITESLSLSANKTHTIEWVSTANALGPYSEQRPPDAICHLGYPVNLRFLAPDIVPSNYFGNALVSAIVTSTVKDILEQPIGYLAAQLRQAGEAITPDGISGKVNELAGLLAMHRYILGTDCCYSDWTKFELQSLDFGHGHPICVRSPRTATISPTCLLRNMLPQQDGLEVYLVDSSVHITRMKEDKELCKYFDGSIE